MHVELSTTFNTPPRATPGCRLTTPQVLIVSTNYQFNRLASAHTE